MKFIIAFPVFLFLLMGTSCKPEGAENPGPTTGDIIPTTDSIEVAPAGVIGELGGTYGTDSIRKIEEIRKDSLRKIFEENKKQSKNNNKSCQEILKEYEEFLETKSGKLSEEKLRKELRTWMEDVPFQSCLKGDPILSNLKDSLEEKYL